MPLSNNCLWIILLILAFSFGSMARLYCGIGKQFKYETQSSRRSCPTLRASAQHSTEAHKSHQEGNDEKASQHAQIAKAMMHKRMTIQRKQLKSLLKRMVTRNRCSKRLEHLSFIMGIAEIAFPIIY